MLRGSEVLRIGIARPLSQFYDPRGYLREHQLVRDPKENQYSYQNRRGKAHPLVCMMQKPATEATLPILFMNLLNPQI